MRNTISRTFTSTVATCLVFDTNDNKVLETVVTLSNVDNKADEVEKFLRKNPDRIVGKLIMVKDVSVKSELIGMDETDFIKYATPVQERTKETRGMISKTVNTLCGTLKYMDTTDNTIKEKIVTVPEKYKNNPDKYAYNLATATEKPFMITDLKNVSSLFVMNELEFRTLGKPMVNHQKYVE